VELKQMQINCKIYRQLIFKDPDQLDESLQIRPRNKLYFQSHN
jgi:hypothetical protein